MLNKPNKIIRCKSCGTKSQLYEIQLTESLWAWHGPEGWYCKHISNSFRDYEYVCYRCVSVGFVNVLDFDDPWIPVAHQTKQ